MIDSQNIFLACIVGVVALGVWGVMRLLSRDDSQKIRQRLIGKPTTTQGPARSQKSLKTEIKGFFGRLGQAAAKPFLPETREKQSALRKKLSQAGIYSPSSIRTITGAKVLLLCGGLGGGYFAGLAMGSPMLFLAFGGLLGYLMPMFWLRNRISTQQRALDYGLPDAIDLMVVCVEAGLAIDAAMQRVGEELNIAHPALSKELDIAHMEMRVGLSRLEALKNMANRTGNIAMQSLVSMIIQADRFGTSIAQALRVHAESMRIARQHRAEEMAAKAAVKISLPLVLFIFPSTFIVLAGPTVVNLMNSSLFK